MLSEYSYVIVIVMVLHLLGLIGLFPITVVIFDRIASTFDKLDASMLALSNLIDVNHPHCLAIHQHGQLSAWLRLRGFVQDSAYYERYTRANVSLSGLVVAFMAATTILLYILILTYLESNIIFLLAEPMCVFLIISVLSSAIPMIRAVRGCVRLNDYKTVQQNLLREHRLWLRQELQQCKGDEATSAMNATCLVLDSMIETVGQLPSLKLLGVEVTSTFLNVLVGYAGSVAAILAGMLLEG
jgi:hypothetical protein